MAAKKNFKDVRSVAGSVENNRLRFDKLAIPYAGSFGHILGDFTRRMERWDGSAPRFLSYQVEAWSELRADRIVELRDVLEAQFPGRIQFVRADHYFNLYNQANGLPFNLCLDAKTLVTASDGSASAGRVTDGTPNSLWISGSDVKGELEFDFGSDCVVSRCLIRHAGAAGFSPELNTKAYRLEFLAPGGDWPSIHQCQGNTGNVTDVEFARVTARKVRIVIENAGADAIARIADVELYGTRGMARAAVAPSK